MNEETKRKADELDPSYREGLLTLAQSFCLPFWWHDPNNRTGDGILHNGTVCLVNTGAKVMAVTANHVLTGLEADLRKMPELVCQFGSITVNPLDRLIDRDATLDLATFAAPDFADIAWVSHRVVPWPSKRIEKGEVVYYGGFPKTGRTAGQLKAKIYFDAMFWTPMDVTDRSIVLTCGNEQSYWPNKPEGEEINIDPGGYSGGPVYRVDETAPTTYLELVGFISELTFFPVMRATHADFARADGTIAR